MTTRQKWTDVNAWQTQDIDNTNDPQKEYRIGTVYRNILLEGLNRSHGANLALNSDVDQDTFVEVTKHNKHDSQESALSQQVTTGLQGTDTNI